MKRRDILRVVVILLVVIGMSGHVLSKPFDETLHGELLHEDLPPEEVKDQTVSPEIITWLQENAIPFKTAEPGSNYEDLMPLKEVIGDARIVALGEATHGTSEFFKMKHRMLEFLVKEMGFNIFAIEATWPESNLVNDYVHTGEGDPAELLAGLYFWTWNTKEVLNMIKWMRKHNKNPGTAPTVSFFGFDMQFPIMAMDNVIEYLHEVDPEAVEYVDSLYAPFRSIMSDHKSLDDYLNTPQSIKDQCRKNVQEVYDFLKSHQSAYEEASTPQEFAFALQSARIAVQAEDRYLEDGPRDQYMAENATWILDQAGPESKMVIWAHNGHVGYEFIYSKPMGWYLQEKYGDEMVVFGFTFYSGSFNAFTYREPRQFGRLSVHQVGPPPKYSCEYYFHSAGIPQFFLDLRGIQPGSATSWLLRPRRFRSIGAAYNALTPLKYFQKSALPNVFDVIIYFEDTSPSHLLGL